MMSLSGTSPRPHLILATGAKPRYPARIKVRLLPAIKGGASPQALRKLVVKTVRDVAYQDNRKATVGSSVQSVVIGRACSGDILGHIPGGTTLLEGPNIIDANTKFADMYIDVSGDPQWRYDPALGKARIAELTCSNCGAPVPEGYRRCGVCDAPASPPTGGPGT